MAAKIKIIGIGGAGINAIDTMIQEKVRGVDFIAVNTDTQSLNKSKAENKLQIGEKVCKGLGAGGNISVGAQAMEDDKEKILTELEDSDLIFITAGLGGGTGSGAAPIIAEAAKKLDILTIAVVAYPFSFEGKKRTKTAEESIQKLKSLVDTLIIVHNDKLLNAVEKNTSVLDAFGYANDILRHSVQSISDLIIIPGLINLDFADIRTIMKNSGKAIIGIGLAKGEDKAIKAAESAIISPLLDQTIEGASKILLNITSGPDISLFEVNQASELITEAAHPDAHIIFGTVIDENMTNEVKVTIIATAFSEKTTGKKEKAINNYSQRNEFKEEKTPIKSINTEMKYHTLDSPYDEDKLDIPTFLRKN